MKYIRTIFALLVTVSQLHGADKVTRGGAVSHEDALYGKNARTLLIVESERLRGRLWSQGRYHGGVTLTQHAMGAGAAVVIIDGDDAYVYPPIEPPSGDNENAGELGTTSGDANSISAAVRFVNSDKLGVRLSARATLERLVKTKSFDRVLLYTDGHISNTDRLNELTVPIHLYFQAERLTPQLRQIPRPVVTLAKSINVASINAFNSSPSASRATTMHVWIHKANRRRLSGRTKSGKDGHF